MIPYLDLPHEKTTQENVKDVDKDSLMYMPGYLVHVSFQTDIAAMVFAVGFMLTAPYKWMQESWNEAHLQSLSVEQCTGLQS